MRFIAFVFIIALIPLLANWYKSNPALRHWAYAGLGILPFVSNYLNLDASVISWAAWPGYAKGLTLTALDSLAIAIIIVTPGALRKLPFMLVMWAYIGAALVSVAFSNSPMSSFFYVFQLIRILLLYVAVAAVITRPNALRWLAYGLAAGAVFQAVMAIQERLAGTFQASGTMGHQNLLGMMLHFVTIPLLAMLLAGMRSKMIYAGVVAGLVTVSLGASRGSIGFVVIGCAVVVVLSLARGMTSQKWKVVGLGVLALAVTAPIMSEGISRRLEANAADDSGYDERAAFENAARMMWNDHPMGVGANQYVVSVNAMGYNNRAGIAWSWASRSTNVHNLYLLAGSETGYLGMCTLIALLIWPVICGVIFSFRKRKDPRGDVVLGFSVALGVCAAHSLYEWIFVVYQGQYMAGIALGVIAGILRQDRMAKPAKRRKGVNPASATGAEPAQPVPDGSEPVPAGG